MIKLVVGLKGSGKTKTLIERANTAADETKGSVVCIEKGDKLIHEIKYQVRLVDTNEYNVTTAASLYGFIAGMYASNHDITNIFVDSALKICGNNMETFEQLVLELDKLTEKNSFEVFMTSSCTEDELPESIKKYL
ncbi:MAG: ATP-binding protein [Ruminococcaceae bacterium]|nr:ATP-binding protein [Oscillospiraceae bacterium]